MRLVISDTHIGDDRGDRHLGALFRVIEHHAAPDSHLILNGDIFDLASRMSMDGRHREFIEVARRHGRVTYIEGNHDWIIKEFGEVLSRDIKFANELRFKAGGRKFRVLHGHQYDFVANYMPRTNRLMIKINHLVRRFTDVDLQKVLRRTGISRWLLAHQEKRIARRERWADVIVAGHTHRPVIAHYKQKTYVNTGDWVERPNRAYLLIDDGGEFELCRPP
jgi:UDP-2,3-diacylglucosamine hydrolase